MQSVHQTSHQHVHTEDLICVLPYGDLACRMQHLQCQFYVYEISSLNLNIIT